MLCLCCNGTTWQARNKFAIESQFGGADELLQLVKGAQKQGVAVMLDIVANHLGPGGNFPSDYTPFDNADYFHGDPSNHCQAQGSDQNTLETCWLVNLPDLKQEHPFVTSTLVKWMTGLQSQYVNKSMYCASPRICSRTLMRVLQPPSVFSRSGSLCYFYLC